MKRRLSGVLLNFKIICLAFVKANHNQGTNRQLCEPAARTKVCLGVLSFPRFSRLLLKFKKFFCVSRLFFLDLFKVQKFRNLKLQ